MNGVQKVIKIFAICLAIFIIVNIFGWVIGGIGFLVHIGGDSENISDRTYETSDVTGESWISWQDIDKINIDLKSAKLVIKAGGNELVVKESDENNFRVNKSGNELRINEKDGWFVNHDRLDTLEITIPEGMLLKELDIDSGAGRVEIEGVEADKFAMDQGAGVVEIARSRFNRTKISGGAGSIKINSSILNDLKLEAGVGKVEIESDITGDSKIDCGIGEVAVKLNSPKEDYRIRVEKGIGSIKIDGETWENNSTYGNGSNKLDIERWHRCGKYRVLKPLGTVPKGFTCNKGRQRRRSIFLLRISQILNLS